MLSHLLGIISVTQKQGSDDVMGIEPLVSAKTFTRTQVGVNPNIEA